MPRLAALLVLVAACFAATEKPPVAVVPREVSLEDYLQADTAFGCLAYGCLFGIATSELPAFCGPADSGADDKRRAVLAGRMRFDAQKAKTCVPALEAYAPADCWGAAADFDADLDRLLAACAGVLVGTVADGGDCVFSGECPAASYCDATAAVCPGHCVHRRGVGGACSAVANCEDGLACIGSKCTQRAGPGEGCDVSHPCRGGLFCEGGHCAGPAAEGAGCSLADASCGHGLYCAKAAAGDGSCAPRLAAGASCEKGSKDVLGVASPQCAGNQVCVGLVLDDQGAVLFAGKCANPVDLAGACAPTNGRAGAALSDSGCFLGLQCDAGSKTCARFAGPGGACPDKQCDTTAYCADRLCHALKADGDACKSSSECLNSCVSGACRAASATRCHAN